MDGEIEAVIADVWRRAFVASAQFDATTDFFALGGHSVLALEVLAKINDRCGTRLSLAELYMNPTIGALAQCASGSPPDDELVDLGREAVLDEAIQPLSQKYTGTMHCVLLTGATGFVGRFLLRELLERPGVVVYCLVRAASHDLARQRLHATLLKWGLWHSEFEPHLVIVRGDLRLPQLGLDSDTYRRMCERIDSIFHCATSMNHLETYQAARAANVEGTVEILRLATRDRPKQLNYISTLGVFSRWAGSAARSVNEQSCIDGELHVQSHGYVASKWVGEKLVMLAADRGIACNILRLGFIWADTAQGRYDELQRDYRLIKSCLLLNCAIRHQVYDMAPTPVDYAARAIVVLADQNPAGGRIFHVSAADHAVEDLFEQYNQVAAQPLELIGHYDWIQEVRRLHLQGRSLPIVPVIEYAFAMDRASFERQHLEARAADTHFHSVATRRVLEGAGVFAPTWGAEQLQSCIKSMLSRDADLQRDLDAKGFDR